MKRERTIITNVPAIEQLIRELDIQPASEKSCCTRDTLATELSIDIREVRGSNLNQDTRYPH
jgi:hypothetical protein